MTSVALYRGPERRFAARRISNAGTIFDMLALMTCRAGYHMEGTHHMYTTVIAPTATRLGRHYSIKAAVGYPWDIRLYDTSPSGYIYAYVTELNWSNPNDFKATLGTLTQPGATIPFMYRYAYIGDSVTTTRPSDSETAIVQNCKQTSSFNIGMVRHEFHGPFTQALGGNVGTVQTYKVYYRWSGQPSGVYLVQETFTYAPTFGLVGWQTQNWNGTAYGPPTASSIFNQLVGGTVAPVFPCTAY